MIAIFFAVVAAVLALAYQHDWGGDATLWYCLLWGEVAFLAAVAAFSFSLPAMPPRQR